MLVSRQSEIHAERDRKQEEARQQQQLLRREATQRRCGPPWRGTVPEYHGTAQDFA